MSKESKKIAEMIAEALGQVIIIKPVFECTTHRAYDGVCERCGKSVSR